jgi:hypothetical protein
MLSLVKDAACDEKLSVDDVLGSLRKFSVDVNSVSGCGEKSTKESITLLYEATSVFGGFFDIGSVTVTYRSAKT